MNRKHQTGLRFILYVHQCYVTANLGPKNIAKRRLTTRGRGIWINGKHDRQNAISIRAFNKSQCESRESDERENSIETGQGRRIQRMRAWFDDEIGYSEERKIKRRNSDMEKEIREAVLSSRVDLNAPRCGVNKNYDVNQPSSRLHIKISSWSNEFLRQPYFYNRGKN